MSGLNEIIFVVVDINHTVCLFIGWYLTFFSSSIFPFNLNDAEYANNKKGTRNHFPSLLFWFASQENNDTTLRQEYYVLISS